MIRFGKGVIDSAQNLENEYIGVAFGMFAQISVKYHCANEKDHKGDADADHHHCPEISGGSLVFGVDIEVYGVLRGVWVFGNVKEDILAVNEGIVSDLGYRGGNA